jgi:hypothetical protein
MRSISTAGPLLITALTNPIANLLIRKRGRGDILHWAKPVLHMLKGLLHFQYVPAFAENNLFANNYFDNNLFLGCPFFASDKKMRNVAKTKRKDAKTNSKQTRGSETKQNKVSLL